MTYRKLVEPASTHSIPERVRRIGNNIRGACRASPDVNKRDQVDAFRAVMFVCGYVSHAKPGKQSNTSSSFHPARRLTRDLRQGEGNATPVSRNDRWRHAPQGLGAAGVPVGDFSGAQRVGEIPAGRLVAWLKEDAVMKAILRGVIITCFINLFVHHSIRAGPRVALGSL